MTSQLLRAGVAFTLLVCGLQADEQVRSKPVASSPAASALLSLEPRTGRIVKVLSTAPAVRPKALTPRSLTSTTISEVLAQDVTLDPGAAKQFFANSDFTGTEIATLGFYTSSDQDLSATTYLVWWAPPNAPSYVVSDYLAGGDFAFLNSGGSRVAVFGNQLMIEMRNGGTKPVTIKQITVWAVAH